MLLSALLIFAKKKNEICAKIKLKSKPLAISNIDNLHPEITSMEACQIVLKFVYQVPRKHTSHWVITADFHLSNSAFTITFCRPEQVEDH